jgi:hypothetical protein
MRKAAVLFLLLLALGSTSLWSQQTTWIQFIFTSDSHYGITRPAFRGGTNVAAHVVNAAMVARMNALPNSIFPADGGLRSGENVGALDFVVDGGDITNRQELAETAIQSAAASWSQFSSDYLEGLTLLDHLGRRAPLYVVPGNHDASNAVGYYKPMMPAIDKTSMVEIFNLMMSPAVPKTVATFDYARDRVVASHDVAGMHFVYLSLWPDTRIRSWMERDLKLVARNTPVIVFAHDPPDADSKHFQNPNGAHDINNTDKFENLLEDRLADAEEGIREKQASALLEQAAWEDFVRNHPNVTAYFHGHNNWNQFYDWTGPNHTVALHTFRVDSPMKGKVSTTDETKLSFQIATIDTASRTMTVREVLWNADPQHPNAPAVWGGSTTVALNPR